MTSSGEQTLYFKWVDGDDGGDTSDHEIKLIRMSIIKPISQGKSQGKPIK